jgi:hypothetical protein
MIWLLTPPPSTVRKLDARHTRRLRKFDNLLNDDRGGGGVEEPNHTAARMPSPL